MGYGHTRLVLVEPNTASLKALSTPAFFKTGLCRQPPHGRR